MLLGREVVAREAVDMRGAEWISADRFEPVADARRFENWEFAYGLVLGLGAAARYALSIGVEAGGRRARELAMALRGKLAALSCVRVLDRGIDLAAIVTLDVAGWDARDPPSDSLRHEEHTNSPT